MTAFELVAVVVTLAAVYLTTRQIIWCWPTSLVSVSMYAVVFFQAKLYADMGLQAIYFVLAIYGWWTWLHGGEDYGKLKVSRSSRVLGMVLFAIGAGFGFVLGTTLHRFTDASIPFMDSTLSSFSIVAQWMQTRKLLESWLVWIVVDVLYVGMFIYKGLFLTAGLYAVFLYLALRGYLNWKRSMETAD
jgi:nicotinamide mononucleotide transporter